MIQIHKAKDGQFFNVIVAKNGEKLAHSETYTTKSNAKRGAKALFRALNIVPWRRCKIKDMTDE